MIKLPRIIGSKKLVVLISVFLGLGLIIFWSVKTSHEGPITSPITHSTDTPVEVAPKKETYQWKGNAEDPKYITLPTISAEGFIQKAGVDQNNQIAVPNNIQMAAWFYKSDQPGKPGLSIIDGHVNGRVNAGIFKNLSSLKIGDVFSVELGGGAIKKFKVIKLDTVDVKDSVNILFSQDPSVASQLNLITCGGSYDSTIHGYTKRVIASSAYVN